MPDGASKAGWTRVAFGDVVKLSVERSSDPKGQGFERFVGLDHIDPGDLRIRRWGNLVDGSTFTNVFRPGQVLFGKRRAYQRKVAVADFNGVCSSDIYVLEPRGAGLLPELLPFICQTDGFYDHAVGTSAGSLSPRTNWGSLARYEFALPPPEEQRRVSELFEALEDLAASYSDVTKRLQDVQQAVVNVAPGQAVIPLGEVAALVTKGTTPSTIDRDYVPDGVPFLRAEDILDGEVDLVNCQKHIDRETHDLFARSKIKELDVLLTIAGTIGRVGLIPAQSVEANCNQAVAIIRFQEDVHAHFVAAWLQSAEAQAQIRGGRVTGTISNLSLGEIKTLKLPLLSRAEMRQYFLRFQRLSVERERIERRRRSLNRFKAHALGLLTSAPTSV